MPHRPLDVLKRGFEKLKKSVAERKKDLEARLMQRDVISASDEQWLDNDANFVDEDQVILRLENAQDYNKEIEQLDEKGKAVVQKLREWAGDISKCQATKHKRQTTLFVFVIKLTDI